MGYNRVLGHLTNSQELAVPWQTGQLYLANQVVINTNLMYLCNTQHTSGATFAGDAAYWTGLNPAATVTIAQGGTGQTTKTDAFDALSPTTTAGDIIVYNGTDNVRQGIGTDGQVLIVDTSQPNKLKWSTAPSGNTNFITNGGAEANNTTGWATYAESDAVTFQDAGDTVTLNNHGLANGNQISFTSITSTTGISTNTLYYVISATTNTFQVATTATGSALPLTTNGSGTMVRFAPKTGAGGSANVTIAASNSSPLIGSYSFLLAKDANNREGQGWEYDFTIDSGYQAKVLQISFNYIVSTAAGTFVAGTNSTVSDVTVWIYDVTNGVMIQPSSSKLLSNSTTVSDTFNATFQTASNSTAYRLIFHVSTPSTTAYTLKVDGISVSPSTYVYGTPVTDWQSYTPTFTGFGTVTNIEFQWRRAGDSLEVKGKATIGTSTATEARVSFPSGLTAAGTDKIPSLQIAGLGARPVANAETIQVLTEPSVTYFTFCRQEATLTGLTKQNGNAVASAQALSFFARAPISGWSSSVQTSDQTDTRVVSAVMQTQASNYTLPSSGDITWSGGTIFDTHGAFNGTTSYVVPVSGIYQIGIEGANTSANTYFWVYKNGTQLANSFGIVAYGTSTTIGSGYLVDKFNAGDILTIRSNSAGSTILYYSASTYRTTWSVTRLSGPSAIAASESVNASYWVTTTATVTTGNPFNFDGKDWDTHNAVTTGAAWKFTAPISGKYMVTGYINPNSNPAADMSFNMRKNGVFHQAVQSMRSTSAFGAFSSTIMLNAGDYIDIRPDANYQIFGNASRTAALVSYLQITRIGN